MQEKIFHSVELLLTPRTLIDNLHLLTRVIDNIHVYTTVIDNLHVCTRAIDNSKSNVNTSISARQHYKHCYFQWAHSIPEVDRYRYFPCMQIGIYNNYLPLWSRYVYNYVHIENYESIVDIHNTVCLVINTVINCVPVW